MRTSLKPLLLLSTLLLAACPPSTSLTGSGMDMFAPAKIRIHPLSRFVLGGGEAGTGTVEFRLEFTDQFTHPGKGAGRVLLKLFDEGQGLVAMTQKGQLLGAWPFPLDTPETNRDHWDPTTRTYLFKVPLPPNTPNGNRKFILHATFTLPNGTILEDELELAR